jgi:hypothetical protein
LDEIEPADVIFHLGPGGGALVGLKGHKEHVIDFGKAFSGLKMEEPEYIHHEGSYFSFWIKGRTLLTASLPGMPPAGKEISATLMYIGRVKKDKVAEVWCLVNFQ